MSPGVTCSVHAPGVTCSVRVPGVACSVRAPGMTCSVRAPGMTCSVRAPRVTCSVCVSRGTCSCLLPSTRIYEISRESGPGFSRIIASALGHRVGETLCMPFRSGVSFSQPSRRPQHKPLWPLKPSVLGARPPGAGIPGWGA